MGRSLFLSFAQILTKSWLTSAEWVLHRSVSSCVSAYGPLATLLTAGSCLRVCAAALADTVSFRVMTAVDMACIVICNSTLVTALCFVSSRLRRPDAQLAATLSDAKMKQAAVLFGIFPSCLVVFSIPIVILKGLHRESQKRLACSSSGADGLCPQVGAHSVPLDFGVGAADVCMCFGLCNAMFFLFTRRTLLFSQLEAARRVPRPKIIPLLVSHLDQISPSVRLILNIDL